MYSLLQLAESITLGVLEMSLVSGIGLMLTQCCAPSGTHT